MSSSDTSTSQTFLTLGSRTGPSKNIMTDSSRFSTRMSTMNGTRTNRGTKTGHSEREKTKGKMEGYEEDFEDTNTIPFNRMLYYLSLFIPCASLYGLSSLRTHNRREKLWALALITYAFLFIVTLVVAITLFISLNY